MDYYKIGQKIRKYRKLKGLSQEELAEKIGISVTHMSHIETANTKLSLQVLVDISLAIDVRMDDLLFDRPSARETAFGELSETLEKCSVGEIWLITELAKTAKLSLEKYKDEI